MIKYGIGTNYLLNWGFKEALREIYQNFFDAGDYTEEIVKEYEGQVTVELSNEWSPADCTFLKIGESGKRGDKTSIGEHGEGMKMAMMVLHRNGCQSVVAWLDKVFISTIYDDQYLGKCFGLEPIRSSSFDQSSTFKFQYVIPRKEYEEFKGTSIKDEEVIYEHEFGQIIDKPAGDVYIGGLFVSNLPNMNRAYNFKPECVKLDRDRMVPKSFDVEYYASRILASWEHTNIDDITARDGSYLHALPNKLAKKFDADLVGETVVFSSGETVAPQNIKEILMKIPSNIKKVEKLKYKMSKKRRPHSILKEYFDKHPVYGTENKIDLKLLLKQSKDWK